MQARDEKEKQEAERLKPEKDREHSWWNPFGHSDTKDSKVPKKESSSWFSSPAKATEPEKKHWYDFMPAHQDRTKQTRAGVLKAAMTGKDADVAKAVAHHKVCVHESKRQTTRLQTRSIVCVATYSIYTLSLLVFQIFLFLPSLSCPRPPLLSGI